MGWTHAQTFAPYGAVVGIRSNDGEIAERLRLSLLECWGESDALVCDVLFSVYLAPPSLQQPIDCRLYVGDQLGYNFDSVEQILAVFRQLLVLHLGESALSRVFVHAGVVVWGGRAVLLPGASHTGKSTLVASMVELGGIYYSDDMALLDLDGQVHPYPKPLSLRQTSDTVLEVPAHELGWTRELPSAFVALVVGLKFGGPTAVLEIQRCFSRLGPFHPALWPALSVQMCQRPHWLETRR